MGKITTEKLADNPLYKGLNFAGVDVDYSPSFLHNQIVKDLTYAKSHNGSLPVNGFTDYLRWRWLEADVSGNEARFEHYHCPKITTALECDFSSHVVETPQPPLPTYACSSLPPSPPPCQSTAVPEPASIILIGMAIVGLAAILGMFRRAR